MKLMTFLLLTGAIMITGWMLGSKSLMDHMASEPGSIFSGNLISLEGEECNANALPSNSSSPTDILPNCKNNNTVIGAIVLALISFAFILVLAGFSTMYIIPIILIVALLGFEILFMPIGFLMDSSVSAYLRVPFFTIWNILGISVIIDFISGK